jgi:hypothetical protein
VELFPLDASNERITWLSLSDTFLYEFSNGVLELRRTVVEIGQACAKITPTLEHINAMYRLDCAIIDPSWCQENPSVPFRRLVTHRIRLTLNSNGTGGTLVASKTDALNNIPMLANRNDALGVAFARLVIMLLTAAVVFIRGSQHAASARAMYQLTLDKVHNGLFVKGSQKIADTLKHICTSESSEIDNESLSHALFTKLPMHSAIEVFVDGLITTIALGSRFVVLIATNAALTSDGLTHIVLFETLGCAASMVHIIIRYGCFYGNRESEAPLTKLGGPMSLVDVAQAVMLIFFEAPILNNDEGRFTAIGRLLVGILVCISVLTRCAFSVSLCGMKASFCMVTPTLCGKFQNYAALLVLSAALWTIQGVASSVSLASLCIVPTAYTLVRSVPGNAIPIVSYAALFGLVTTGMPTSNKIALRLLQHGKQILEAKYNAKKAT